MDLMVSAAYETMLRALRSEIQAAEGGPLSIEQELTALLNEGGPNLAMDLLLSLSDGAHGGAMYALVHAAESLDKAPYRSHISTVLSILPRLFETAPNWALDVLRRIMNADASLCELVRQLRGAPAPIKETVRNICTLNDAISPDYMPETVKAQVARAAS